LERLTNHSLGYCRAAKGEFEIRGRTSQAVVVFQRSSGPFNIVADVEAKLVVIVPKVALNHDRGIAMEVSDIYYLHSSLSLSW
jgi:hypothetical protein